MQIMPFADAETLISVEMNNNNALLRYITLQWCIMFKPATTIHSAGIQIEMSVNQSACQEMRSRPLKEFLA
jgi:hypothetical protein